MVPVKTDSPDRHYVRTRKAVNVMLLDAKVDAESLLGDTCYFTLEIFQCFDEYYTKAGKNHFQYTQL
jgi:hypothetical protein